MTIYWVLSCGKSFLFLRELFSLSKSSLVSHRAFQGLWLEQGEVKDHPKSCEVEKSTQGSWFDVGIWSEC